MNFFTYDISSISPVKLCIIPMVILVLSLVSVGMMWMQTGLPVSPGIEFQGGISVTIVTDETPEELKEFFPQIIISSVVSEVCSEVRA